MYKSCLPKIIETNLCLSKLQLAKVGTFLRDSVEGLRHYQVFTLSYTIFHSCTVMLITSDYVVCLNIIISDVSLSLYHSLTVSTLPAAFFDHNAILVNVFIVVVIIIIINIIIIISSSSTSPELVRSWPS